ncbi:MAG: hypothetical protein RLZZ528_337 [Pseudomonadota bacterium]
MYHSAVAGASGPGIPAGAAPLRVLIVDDSRMQRRILASNLARAGHQVSEAGDGAAALEICRTTPPDLILSDWMMPGISGLDLCRQVRALGLPGYVYFILLTSRSDKADAASGLDVGADDFLTKPVHADELRARILAGQRILAMERELQRRNEVVSSTLAELQGLYGSIRRDLGEARKLQQSLVRARHSRFGPSSVSMMLHSSNEVGGDLVGCFPISPGKVALYAIDVSGHGIASALMTARIAACFSGGAPGQNIALRPLPGGGHAGESPDIVAQRLNRLILQEVSTGIYLTLIYAEVELATGLVRYVQAGHPPPVILRADSRIEASGDGGFPVGLIDGAGYEVSTLTLDPGDRLLILSDGFTEARVGGEMLQEDGAALLFLDHPGLSGPALLDAARDRLVERTGRAPEDDLSAVLLDFQGA